MNVAEVIDWVASFAVLIHIVLFAVWSVLSWSLRRFQLKREAEAKAFQLKREAEHAEFMAGVASIKADMRRALVKKDDASEW